MGGFSSDIISEVVAAADPGRAEAARRRLASLAAPAPTDFASLVLPTPAQSRDPVPASSTRRVDHRKWKQPAARETPLALAYRSLGAVLLQKAFEAMTPAASSDGASRSASTIWKSMLAQQFAESVSTTMFKLPNSLSDSGRQDSPGTGRAAATMTNGNLS